MILRRCKDVTPKHKFRFSHDHGGCITKIMTVTDGRQHEVQGKKGLLFDDTIRLRGYYHRTSYPEKLKLEGLVLLTC